MSFGSFAQSKPSLSLNQCIQEAMQKNALLKTGNLEIQTAEALIASGRDVPKSTLDFQYGKTQTYFSQDYTVIANQNIPWPTQLRAQVKALTSQKMLAEKRLKVTQILVKSSVKWIYYQILLQNQQVKFLQKQDSIYSQMKRAAQLKFKATGETALRVGLNTFLGLGGLLDIASDMGIERHRTDFGLTLGHWGVPSGPYLVLPMLGPSTLRDAASLPVDWQGDISRQSASAKKRDWTLGLKITDIREGLLQIVDAVKEASLDPYSFTRDAYLQKRRNDQFDGNPPLTDEGDDPDETELKPTTPAAPAQ
jgi:ABC-type transporter lipoprotein component MlaA